MEGARVRTARAEAGLTLMELAKRSGVTRDTISKIERNVHEPQAGTLAKIAAALDRPVAYFTEGSEPGKDDAPLSLEWAGKALPEEFSRTIQESHTEILKDLREALEHRVWDSRDERGFLTDRVAAERVSAIEKELRRRDPPAFSIKLSRDAIQVLWLVPMEERAPYRELLVETLQETINRDSAT